MGAEGIARPVEGRKFVIFISSVIVVGGLFTAWAIRERSKADWEAAQATAYQRSAPETPEQQQAAEHYAREYGESIYYSEFYAKVESSGLPVGKRYRFRAFVDEGTGGNIFLHNPSYPQGPQKQLQGTEAFDNESDHESFLRSNSTDPREVVAAMDASGTILVYKVN